MSPLVGCAQPTPLSRSWSIILRVLNSELALGRIVRVVDVLDTAASIDSRLLHLHIGE